MLRLMAKSRVRKEPSLLVALGEETAEVDWTQAEERALDERDLVEDAAAEAQWTALPPAAGKGRSYTGWRRKLHDHLYRTRTLELLESPSHGIRSEPGETERDFRIRLGDLARERRDAEVEKLRERYRRKAATLEERIRRARAKVEKEREQAGGEKLKTAISVGTALLSVLTGRKGISKTDLSRMGSAMRGVGRTAEQSRDVDRAQETVEALIERLEEQNLELEEKIGEVEERLDPQSELGDGLGGIERSVLNVVWEPPGRMSLWVMGQRVARWGGRDGGETDGGGGGDADSGAPDREGEGTAAGPRRQGDL